MSQKFVEVYKFKVLFKTKIIYFSFQENVYKIDRCMAHDSVADPVRSGLLGSPRSGSGTLVHKKYCHINYIVTPPKKGENQKRRRM